MRGTLLRTGLWLLLGGWVGSWVFFATVIARTAFQVLPSTEIAGQLVGPVLEVLHLYGAFAGVGVSALAWGLGRRGTAVALPLVLSGLCLYSQFGITGEMNEIRAQVFGPQGDELSAARYNALHRRSMGVFTLGCLGGLFLTALHARADAREASHGPAHRPEESLQT